MEGDIASATGDIFGKKRKIKQKIDTNSEKRSEKHEAETNHKRFKTEADRPRPTGSASPVSQVFRGVNVIDFVEARALEVSNTVKALREAGKMEGKRVLQRLPRHMRRRAASYDVRRIPRSQRKFAMREEGSNPIKRSKMPSRKYRRRPKNLLEEYNRRKRNHAWLETHIWHAKRFKMTERWGYKIAEQPSDKGFRSAYRASSNGCIMQDISYHGCIEIIGPEEEIITTFKHLSHEKTAPKLSQRYVLSGERASIFMLYHYNQYPFKAIGPVQIMWKPRLRTEHEVACGTDVRQLWVWCHPSCHDEAVETIKEAFIKCIDDRGGDNGSLSPEQMGISETAIGEIINNESEQNDTKDTEKSHKLKDQEHGNKPSIFSEKFVINERVSVKSMKLDFVKIRLTGPLSHQILVDSLQLHNMTDTNHECWWKEYYTSRSNHEALNESIESWKLLKFAFTSELPPHVVFGLTVIDPRMNLPIKKTWPGKESDKGNYSTISTEDAVLKRNLLTKWSSTLCTSPIWSETIREEVKGAKISEAELNEKRSKKLDIGERLGIEDETARIPILLIQRPGGTDELDVISQYGSGWDIIIPNGWGMAFWLSFIYRGAHASGQREERNVSFESRKPYFPKECPDTVAGRNYLEAEMKKNEDAFERHPASKRCNYKKLGIDSPFGPDWQHIVSEWKENLYAVMQCLDMTLKADPEAMDHTLYESRTIAETSPTPKEGEFLAHRDEAPLFKSTGNNFYVLRDVKFLRELNGLFHSCIVRKRRNTPSALIDDELSITKQNQVLHKLREIQSNVLIAVFVECIGRGEATDNALISIPTRTDIERLSADVNYFGPKEPLHKGLKDSFPAISDACGVRRSLVKHIGSCSRWTIGHVTSGRYSLRSGKGTGVGFVSVAGLTACVKAQKSLTQGCMVLLRNITSQQYRFARLHVVL